MRRLLENLFRNAVDYGGETVTVERLKDGRGSTSVTTGPEYRPTGAAGFSRRETPSPMRGPAWA